MIASPNCSPRGGARVRLVVIHTAEGARTTAELGAYFANAASQVSSHVGIDDAGIEQYVDYAQEAWTIRSGNAVSDNAELCGFAAWTREQWLTQHAGMLAHAADWIAERCHARGIPLQKLSPADVAAGKAGVIGHVDWTQGMRDGTHTDPGTGFPWDVVMHLAAGGPASTPPTPRKDEPVTAIPITPDASGKFRALVMAEVGDVSEIVARAWVTAGAAWTGKPAHVVITALDNGGAVLQQKAFDPGNNRRVVMELPNKTVMATVEGDTGGAIVAAALVCEPK